MRRRFSKHSIPSLQLSLVYVIFSSGWILLGDKMVTEVGYSIETIERLQNVKGLLFVFSSALLLYVVSRSLYRRIQNNLAEKDSLLQKLTGLNEATKEGIIDYDFTTDSAHVNDQMLAFLDTGKRGRIENFTALHHSHIHPDDLGLVLENFARFSKGDGTIWQTAYRYRNRQGAYRNIIGRGYQVREKGTGKPLRMMYALQDVTDLKNADAKYYLQQIEHRRQIAESILKAQDEERNRWAQELHDNVCQVLTVARLYLEQGMLDQPLNRMHRKSMEMVQKALDDIRQLSALIKPPEFSTASLVDSIRHLLADLQRFSKAAFELFLQPETEAAMQEHQKVMVYRLVQEQLNNILKYAEASWVLVSVKLENQEVQIRVEDNGKGFDPQAVKSGIGLRNMQDRLQAAGGRLSIVSAPGEGCSIQASFSL